MSDAGALARRAGPDVVPGRGAQAVGVFQDVEHDAVAVRKCGARIGARAGVDALGIAEEIAEHVQVMDAHDQQRQPVVLRAQGIQCGMARISMVASTGSPR